jgi:hypothetical protein
VINEEGNFEIGQKTFFTSIGLSCFDESYNAISGNYFEPKKKHHVTKEMSEGGRDI